MTSWQLVLRGGLPVFLPFCSSWILSFSVLVMSVLAPCRHCGDGASWMNRLDEAGADALVQLREPVDNFPEFVRLAVQRLRTLCPTMGKKKLSQVLARAGLHLCTTTIVRMSNAPSEPPTPPASGRREPAVSVRIVTAKRPNHVWHIDLTPVPTQLAMWCSWLPWALPQCWPFCWWLALVLDHHSRRIMGFALFRRAPASVEIHRFLARAIHVAGTALKYIISDKGSQFWCAGYKRWCKRNGIQPRFGAIGQHGSIAVIERTIRAMKAHLAEIRSMPYRRHEVRQLIRLLVGWYNEHCPHTTPDGIYFKCFPANRKPGIEPRAAWPRGSPCARPHALVGGKPGARFDIGVELVDGHAHLPIVRLRRAA